MYDIHHSIEEHERTRYRIKVVAVTPPERQVSELSRMEIVACVRVTAIKKVWTMNCVRLLKAKYVVKRRNHMMNGAFWRAQPIKYRHKGHARNATSTVRVCASDSGSIRSNGLARNHIDRMRIRIRMFAWSSGYCSLYSTVGLASPFNQGASHSIGRLESAQSPYCTWSSCAHTCSSSPQLSLRCVYTLCGCACRQLAA